MVKDSASKRGVNLDIGEIPNADGYGDENQDPERVTRLTAHAIARLADRLPFSRRISRHLEGTEASAGILSDLLAIVVELTKRNPDLVKSGLESFGDDLRKARAAKAHEKTAQQTQSGVM